MILCGDNEEVRCTDIVNQQNVQAEAICSRADGAAGRRGCGERNESAQVQKTISEYEKEDIPLLECKRWLSGTAREQKLPSTGEENAGRVQTMVGK